MWYIYAGSVVRFVDHINVQNIKNKQQTKQTLAFISLGMKCDKVKFGFCSLLILHVFVFLPSFRFTSCLEVSGSDTGRERSFHENVRK